jgi:hypothetical protein
MDEAFSLAREVSRETRDRMSMPCFSRIARTAERSFSYSYRKGKGWINKIRRDYGWKYKEQLIV